MGGLKDVQNIHGLASEVFHSPKNNFLLPLSFWIVFEGLFPLVYFSGHQGSQKSHNNAYMLQNSHHLHIFALPAPCAISKPFILNESSVQIQSALLEPLADFTFVSPFILVSLQPPIHLIKIGGLTPISLNHLSSWVCGPPICASNLSPVSLKCQCGGASMYLLAMDFPWNAPFSVHPAYVACFDRR